MKKILLVLSLLALFLIAAGPAPSLYVWERPVLSGNGNELILQGDDFYCSVGFTADGEIVQPTCFDGPGVIQVLPQRVNDGYFIIFLFVEGENTAVVAYNPDREDCRIFCNDHLFE